MDVGKVTKTSALPAEVDSAATQPVVSASGGGPAPNESVMVTSIDALARNMRQPKLTQAQVQNFYEIAMKIMNAYQEAAAPVTNRQ